VTAGRGGLQNLRFKDGLNFPFSEFTNITEKSDWWRLLNHLRTYSGPQIMELQAANWNWIKKLAA
jgi:hypothetical protein